MYANDEKYKKNNVFFKGCLIVWFRREKKNILSKIKYSKLGLLDGKEKTTMKVS